jgi:abhydrolase domain-containing protein 6
MKKFLGFVITLASLGCLWAGITYPTVGRLIYEIAIHMESDFYGFEKSSIEVDGVPVALYQPALKKQGSVDGAANDANNSQAKPVLILLHGFTANKDTWLRFAKHFATDYRVFIPDMAGHGDTGFKQEWDYSIPAQARLVLKLMNQLDIEQAHVVGHSMGGFVAATMAVNYPHRIQSVVLMNPVGVMPVTLSKADILIEQGNSPFLIKSRAEFASLLGMSMSKPPYVPQPVQEYLADQFIEQREQIKHVFNEFHRKDLLDSRLDEFRMPVLMIWGNNDDMVSVASLPVWMKGVKNSKSVVYQDLGHMPMVEDPLRVSIDVWGFLNKLGKTN